MPSNTDLRLHSLFLEQCVFSCQVSGGKSLFLLWGVREGLMWGGDEVGRPPLCHSKEAVKPEVPPGKHRQV